MAVRAKQLETTDGKTEIMIKMDEISKIKR